MGFLRRFLSYMKAGKEYRNSFSGLSEEELERHFDVNQYGNFVLTDAVRPSYDLKVVPKTGFRYDVFGETDPPCLGIPALFVSASKEILFDLFLELIGLFGNMPIVVLERTSIDKKQGRPSYADFLRDCIDSPVFKSLLYDYEDFLLNDGFTGIGVLDSNEEIEIQLDEHKLIIVYGEKILDAARGILAIFGIPNIADMGLITDAEHIHYASYKSQKQFEGLKIALGADCEVDQEIDDLFQGQS